MASIQKRDNGKWRARYRDEAGKEHARHFARKVDARAWLDEVTASVVRGDYVDPKAGRITFDAWFAEWSARQVWAPMTVVQADLVRRSVTFGDLPLAAIRKSHVEHWVQVMQSKGYAPNTMATRMMTVRACFKAAISDKRLRDDPCVGVTLPRRRRRDQSMTIPTAEEVGRIMAASSGRMRAYVAVCAFAGLRLGEASGLKIEDVDFLRRQLHVRRQVQKRRGQAAEIRPPKYESERTIHVSDELIQLLSRHIGEHVDNADGWLFTGERGQAIPPTTVHYWWTKTSTLR